MIWTYKDCIVKKISVNEYIPTILVYTIIVGYLMFIIRKHYTKDILNTRHFNN